MSRAQPKSHALTPARHLNPGIPIPGDIAFRALNEGVTGPGIWKGASVQQFPDGADFAGDCGPEYPDSRVVLRVVSVEFGVEVEVEYAACLDEGV